MEQDIKLAKKILTDLEKYLNKIITYNVLDKEDDFRSKIATVRKLHILLRIKEWRGILRTKNW